MRAAPVRRPLTAGQTPPRRRAGTSSDQHEAATMTPAAPPIKLSMKRRGTRVRNSTGTAPSAVSSHVPTAATPACATGDSDRNQPVIGR